jgi:D-apiose dehydrogenase
VDAAPLRVGLIGCGFFAENHLAAWSSMDNVVLAAVCDIDLEKARSAAERHKAGAYYGDAAEMLARERLDFVDIATTMESHASLVALAARRKLPTIVQKPLAPSFEDCVAIVEGTRAAGIPFMVHENTRFLKPVRKIREVIDSGAIGKPTWARVSFRTGHNIYGKQPYLAKVENFVLLDLGVHMLDVARFLMGEASRLYCQTQSIKPGIRGEDMATILLQHESGATSVVEASYASPVHPAQGAGGGDGGQSAPRSGLSTQRLLERRSGGNRRLADDVAVVDAALAWLPGERPPSPATLGALPSREPRA